MILVYFKFFILCFSIVYCIICVVLYFVSSKFKYIIFYSKQHSFVLHYTYRVIIYIYIGIVFCVYCIDI